MRGHFISIEGIECAGKTTQTKRLAERLRKAGREVCSLREPGETAAGEQIRELLLNPELPGDLRPESELFLLCASRCELVHQIITPAIEAGKVVLCDRFIDSTLAYQGYGHGLDVDWVRQLVLFSTGKLMPDATIFLDIPIDAGDDRRFARKHCKDATDRFEQMGEDFFRRVSNGFRRLASQEIRIFQVSGIGTQEEVESRIWDALCDAGIRF